MSTLIKNADGTPSTSVRESVYRNTNGGTFQKLITCKVGFKIKSDVDSDVQILVRKAGTADAFVDVAVTPIDLTPYANTDVLFDIKAHVDADAVAYSSHNITFRVAPV